MPSRKTTNDSTVLCFTNNDESIETYQSAGRSTTTANYKTTKCKGSNYNHDNDNDNNNINEEYSISEEEEKEDMICTNKAIITDELVDFDDDTSTDHDDDKKVYPVF
eukprot:13955434-Ditylum_brightwellii.AAC.1